MSEVVDMTAFFWSLSAIIGLGLIVGSIFVFFWKMLAYAGSV